MKKTYLLILATVFSLKISFAQQGKNGAETISVNNTIVNEYTALTVDAAVGSTSITATNNTLNANGRFSSSLSAGDLIMIIQMQGATITTMQDSTWGTITGYNNCGLNEFAQVTGVSGATTINLKCPLQNSYTASGSTQIIRVPRLTALTVDANDTLTCDVWNGTTGGVITVEVENSTSINGAISATGKGFRGGALQNSGWIYVVTKFALNEEDSAGEKGEGIAGYQSGYNMYGGMYGRGAPANGGGGGNSTNAPGGGGANAGDINDWTGNGNPDTTTDTAYREAWNLEYNGFANSTSSGGGRGGYACSNAVQDPLTVVPGNIAWGDCPWCYRDNAGGDGGRPLDYSTGRLFLGGGGGAGQKNDNNGGGGGNGGGLIYLLSYGTISGTGSILSNGLNGGDDNSTASGGDKNGDGAGGGGAGGTIITNSAGSITGIRIIANGGTGGNQYIPEYPTEAEGGGGGGGGGYVATSNNGGITVQMFGGANGTSNSVSVNTFPPNGATKGGNGIDTNVVIASCLPQLSGIGGSAVVCSGSSTTYSVTPSACGNTTYMWTLPIGWSGTSTTDSITVIAGNTSGTISISVNNVSCPIDTSIMVTVNPAPPLTFQPPSPSTCAGVSISLSVPVSGRDYVWTPGSTLSPDTGNTVLATTYKTIIYAVNGIDSLGCSVSGLDTVIVKQGPGKPTISDSDNVLTSSATQGNQWVRNDTVLAGATYQTYTITIAGYYKVTAKNPVNGCSTTSDSIYFTPTGISQLSINNNQISIYPNPTNSEIAVNISFSAGEVKDWYLQITDVLGRVVYTRQSLNYSNDIDLSDLSSGVYFITVINKMGKAVVPVIKQ